MGKRNCWEVMECGRQQGGENAEQFGTCPAALPNDFNSVNEGQHGGRFCWAIAGTFCDGQVQGTYSKKITNCLRCEFLNQVEREEGKHFIITPQEAITVLDLERATGDRDAVK